MSTRGKPLLTNTNVPILACLRAPYKRRMPLLPAAEGFTKLLVPSHLLPAQIHVSQLSGGDWGWQGLYGR